MTSSPQIDARIELIAFCIDGQEFCIDIMSVREIRSWAPATPMPHAPDYVRGVINLRGAVLPVVDLSRRLGFAPAEPTARHAIIVVQICGQTVGLLVESVSDILTVGAEAIQAAPEVGSETASRYVRGLLALEGRMLTLVATDDLLPEQLGLAA